MMSKEDAVFFREMVALRPSDAPPRLISEYVQGRRMLPLNTPFPGLWDNARTPYLVEFMDDMSPFSPIQHSVTMKARKIGFTTGAENIAAYWTDAYPTDWAYVSASEDLVKDWSERKFDTVIDTMGFRHKITAQSGLRQTRRTGDTGTRKEFVGGCADFYSARSKMATRAQDKRVLIRDEIDGVPVMMSSGEGNWLEVNEAHANSWGSRRKICDLSSPTTAEASNIYAEYKLGDMRKFLVPCPFCGKDQELVFSFSDEGNYGLKADTAAGEILQGYYLCDYCHEAILNHHKNEMLVHGHYEPTKRSVDPTYRSRQVSALYAPVGMISWTDIVKKWRLAQDDPRLLPSFNNLILGLPHEETGSRPNAAIMNSLRGTYHEREIPSGVTFLTMGVDVQAGSEKNERNQARIEAFVLGHGKGYRTWGIEYLVFLGPTDNAFAGAWEILNTWFANGHGVYEREGRIFPIDQVFVDAGNRPEVTYEFCNRVSNTFPVKGFRQIRVDPQKREHGELPGGFKFYRYSAVSGNQWIYELNTVMYKKAIYGALQRSGAANRAGKSGIEKAGFFDFPQEFPDEFFKSLNSEELLEDGTFRQVHERNEALDTCVYATAAQHVFLDKTIALIRAQMKSKGARQFYIDQIGPNEAFDYLEALFAAKRVKSA